MAERYSTMAFSDEELLAMQQFLGNLAKAARGNPFIPVKGYGVTLEDMRERFRGVIDATDIKAKQHGKEEDDE